MNGVINYIAELFYPPRCALCGELTEPGRKRECFCARCRGIWETEKNAVCPECRRRADECRCMPKYNVSRTVDSYRTAALYNSENVRAIISKIKTERDPALEALLARDIANLILKYHRIDGDSVLAYPQRARESVKKYGFDHAALLCDRVSGYIGIPVFRGIKHKSGKQQKTLSAHERGYNAVKSYYIPEKYKAQIKNKRVIFVDDVVTTGATTVVCAALCKAAGADSVSVFSIARTP